MKPWDEVLKSYAPPSSNIESIKEKFQEQAQYFYNISKQQPSTIIRAFCNVLNVDTCNKGTNKGAGKGKGTEIPGPPWVAFNGNIHCEAALASLVKYIGNVDDASSKLRTVLEVWCPICQNNKS
jgi:hypothetical protein